MNRQRETDIRLSARRSREALLVGDFEEALRHLRQATRSLGTRRGRREEIAALWKAARALLRATRRYSGAEHLRRHARDAPDREIVEAAQFDVGALLAISRVRFRVRGRPRRWLRRALRGLARSGEPSEARSRLVHLAVRLVRADQGALVDVDGGEVRIRETADPWGVPLPRASTPIPRGAVLSCLRRGRERMPDYRAACGGRVLVVPVPGVDGRIGALVLRREGPAPRFGEERRHALREFLCQAGPTVAEVERARRAHATAEHHRREERRHRQERSEARARQRRYLKSLQEARRGEARVRPALRFGYDRIVGAGGRMASILKSLDRVIPTDLPLLLLGETGTGKELVARAIHDHSTRRDGPFVSLNSAALPEALVEAELFGHRRGAYTDADRARRGRILEADRGTLFLDEIGEMSLAAQSKLLRVLESGLVRPVGGGDEIEVDLRLIAATNRVLARRVEEGAFREDLFHRINVVPIELPPLRDRLEDLPLLVEHFLGEHAKGPPPEMSDEAFERLRSHPWPGNIRELEMCMRVGLVLCDGPRLLPEHLQIHPPVWPPGEGEGPDLDGLTHRQLQLIEEWPAGEPIRCSTYAAKYGIPPRTASRDLSELNERGLIRKQGAGASTRYILDGGP